MIDKNTERLLISIKSNLQYIRSMVKRKTVSPYELCKDIEEISTETLNSIKDFRVGVDKEGR